MKAEGTGGMGTDKTKPDMGVIKDFVRLHCVLQAW